MYWNVKSTNLGQHLTTSWLLPAPNIGICRQLEQLATGPCRFEAGAWEFLHHLQNPGRHVAVFSAHVAGVADLMTFGLLASVGCDGSLVPARRRSNILTHCLYHTRSHKHGQLQRRPVCPTNDTDHGDQGSTRQNKTQRRQLSEIPRCRLPCICRKALTASKANVGRKQKWATRRLFPPAQRNPTKQPQTGKRFSVAFGWRLKAQVGQVLTSDH